jgi:hypothetical protein
MARSREFALLQTMQSYQIVKLVACAYNLPIFRAPGFVLSLTADQTILFQVCLNLFFLEHCSTLLISAVNCFKSKLFLILCQQPSVSPATDIALYDETKSEGKDIGKGNVPVLN